MPSKACSLKSKIKSQFMEIRKKNIFTLPKSLPLEQKLESELFEPIVKTSDLLIERIISMGQITPPNEWYEQATDEWVLLLQGTARLLFDDFEGETIELLAGDYILISKQRKHRVIYTTTEPPCIWLAIHSSLVTQK